MKIYFKNFCGIRSALTKKNLQTKDWAPPNFVGRIRSNLNLEVILEVKKPPKKSQKNNNRFW